MSSLSPGIQLTLQPKTVHERAGLTVLREIGETATEQFMNISRAYDTDVTPALIITLVTPPPEKLKA